MTTTEFIAAEIDLLRRERNEIVGQMIEAQDKKMKISGWAKQRDLCDARISRLTSFQKTLT